MINFDFSYQIADDAPPVSHTTPAGRHPCCASAQRCVVTPDNVHGHILVRGVLQVKHDAPWDGTSTSPEDGYLTGMRSLTRVAKALAAELEGGGGSGAAAAAPAPPPAEAGGRPKMPPRMLQRG
jgi:hypothetical protein